MDFSGLLQQLDRRPLDGNISLSNLDDTEQYKTTQRALLAFSPVGDYNASLQATKNIMTELKEISAASVGTLDRFDDSIYDFLINNEKFKGAYHLIFDNQSRKSTIENNYSLEFKMKPQCLDDIIGLKFHKSVIIHSIFTQTNLPSFILYGPPGVGKTSLVNVLHKEFSQRYKCFKMDAITIATNTMENLCKQYANAKNQNWKAHSIQILTQETLVEGPKTIIFIDGLDIIPKNQQQELLRLLELEHISLIATCSENLSKHIIEDIISRCHNIKVDILDKTNMKYFVQKAMSAINEIRSRSSHNRDELLNEMSHYSLFKFSPCSIDYISQLSKGDCRNVIKMLNVLDGVHRDFNSIVNIDISSLETLLNDDIYISECKPVLDINLDSNFKRLVVGEDAYLRNDGLASKVFFKVFSSNFSVSFDPLVFLFFENMVRGEELFYLDLLDQIQKYYQNIYLNRKFSFLDLRNFIKNNMDDVEQLKILKDLNLFFSDISKGSVSDFVIQRKFSIIEQGRFCYDISAINDFYEIIDQAVDDELMFSDCSAAPDYDNYSDVLISSEIPSYATFMEVFKHKFFREIIINGDVQCLYNLLYRSILEKENFRAYFFTLALLYEDNYRFSPYTFSVSDVCDFLRQISAISIPSITKKEFSYNIYESFSNLNDILEICATKANFLIKYYYRNFTIFIDKLIENIQSGYLITNIQENFERHSKINLYYLNSQVPYHLRNAPDYRMAELGFSVGYKYNPNYKFGRVFQKYLPNELEDLYEIKFNINNK
ncbi:P-loop containing nucleoside triphosphate hydrolase protein [Ascoidea rubescens DSM 1968]|uniref:p-loop containing nucleoside triphosphate hydrolase protein n=1 Tax=Ascoidea rubescens DSM 1968 TaxID=1344418 RepID=A0A1D2V8M9_9ASCO|nr:P-loop containing nucleoside triphosphate hydrolase protein [Ascoidea rubescens DSM 1968]ODV57990.1 P-loop containing nucleoside triphosphate hydrolase protein [Ascoidea rubescens DSM 1968]